MFYDKYAARKRFEEEHPEYFEDHFGATKWEERQREEEENFSEPKKGQCQTCGIPLNEKDPTLICKARFCGRQHTMKGSDGIHCADCLGEDDKIYNQKTTPLP